MASNIWKLGTQNLLETKLDGNISADTASITVLDTTGFQAPGIITIDRTDLNKVATSASREYISFTGISSNTFTGCSRGLAGSTAQGHSTGARVEDIFTVTTWSDFEGIFTANHTGTGEIAAKSLATLIDVRAYRSLLASGASTITSEILVMDKLDATGAYGPFEVYKTQWQIGGNMSGATTTVGQPVPTVEGGNWQFFTATVTSPTSGATLIIDINKNGTSIFEAGTRPMILMNGTFVSTASINTKAFSPGDTFSMDIDSNDSLAQDLIAMLKGI